MCIPGKPRAGLGVVKFVVEKHGCSKWRFGQRPYGETSQGTKSLLTDCLGAQEKEGWGLEIPCSTNDASEMGLAALVLVEGTWDTTLNHHYQSNHQLEGSFDT